MERVGLLCLLLCGCIQVVKSEIVTLIEGNIGILQCGALTKGKVTWSRDIRGQREDILTTHDGKVTKHLSDPEGRYKAGGNTCLIISRLSQSDAGRYHCNETTVELTVENTSTSSRNEDSLDVWKMMIIASAGCIVGLSLVLLIQRCFSKKKAGSTTKPNKQSVYANTANFRSTPKPDPQQSYYETIYPLQ